ncbi:DNA ligase 6 [Asparagus officinalis]|uniref:DNA ligase 6 n=1 Tax=Asparagus officinalis TaxID=4686 RepID=UPI00098E4632|nr:DNA ligase 6 [Asparagus officinalis]
MATLPSSSSSSSTKILTLNSSSLFLSSFNSLLNSSPQVLIPHSFRLLSQNYSLPPIPSDLPQTKLIPATKFIIDGFKSAGDFSVSYFLSHFHSDHYTGLTPNWSKGIIFCSEVTSKLLIRTLNISPLFVVSLALNATVEIDGCEVAVVDANHCPGAVQFLFSVRGEDGRKLERYVHTGDFRFCDSMKKDPILSQFVGSDAVFLDATYCNPKFVFPSQEESIDYIVRLIKRIREESEALKEPVLILIATYVIGKERILLEISRQLKCLLHVDRRKMSILSVLGLGDSNVFTEDASASSIHVIGWNLLGETWPYFRPNFVKMKEIMLERGYSKAVGFVSTGWLYETKKDGFAVRVKDELEIHLVPYSEHSSYDELREFVRFLRPKRVIPTVGDDADKIDGKSARALQKHFQGLVDETANKQEFLMAFNKKAVNADVMAGYDNPVNVCRSEDVAEEDSLSQKEALSEDFNSEDMEEEIQEIRDSLPSWVTQDQIISLLRSSNGEVVEAVSEFFEHEIEFYEKANVCILAATDPVSQTSSLPPTAPGSQAISHNDFTSFPETKCFPGSQENGSKFVKLGKKPISKNLAAPKSVLPKKRGSRIGNKPKKKGKTSSALELSGSKQPTITKFFGKVISNSTVIAAQESIGGTSLIVDTVEKHKKELNQFLQIIDNGIERSTAASLMEKVKGNVGEAVDVYYSICSSVFGDEEILMPCNHKDHMTAAVSNNCTEEASCSPHGTDNIPSLFVRVTSGDDSSVINISLPIDKYSPVEHACWEAGKPAPYLHLARTFDLVEREKGKIKTTAMLCNMFRSLLALSPNDVLPAVYLCTNKIAPDHENVELNVGSGLVIAALEEACGINKSRIKEMYTSFGDLGDVAQECRQTQALLAPPRPLSIRNLFCTLKKISPETGNGSAVRKKNLVVRIMRSCREMEMKFVVRTLVRNLRIGAMMKTILPALGQAVVLNSYSTAHHIGSSRSLKSGLQVISEEVTEAYNVIPNLDLLIPSLMSKGINFSGSSLEMVPGTPIPPMLARITNGTLHVLTSFQNRAFTCEYKYDGQRAQIHRLADGSIRIFSRQMKDSTSRFPDLINIIKELSNPAFTTFILDTEVVAVDRKGGVKLLSFQDLSSRERGRKDSSITIVILQVDICVFIFDVMFSNGKRLLDLPLRERRTCLKDLFHKVKPGFLEFAKEITVEADEAYLSNESTVTNINTFFEDACKSSCEGIMAKTLDIDAGYCASKRTDAWLKVKRDYIEELGDSLDLVPIGAWYGNGRKAGWYSPFLMACYNPDAEEFQSVCRVMSGFSDEFYKSMKEFFSGEKILSRKPPYYQTDESPDLWFSAEVVWEIRGADFTISPVHHSAVGLIHPSRGISVRLPRFVRPVSDRKPEDCTTAADIACMFNSQTRKMYVGTEH